MLLMYLHIYGLSRPKQDDRHFPHEIYKQMVLNKDVFIFNVGAVSVDDGWYWMK